MTIMISDMKAPNTVLKESSPFQVILSVYPNKSIDLKPSLMTFTHLVFFSYLSLATYVSFFDLPFACIYFLVGGSLWTFEEEVFRSY